MRASATALLLNATPPAAAATPSRPHTEGLNPPDCWLLLLLFACVLLLLKLLRLRAHLPHDAEAHPQPRPTRTAQAGINKSTLPSRHSNSALLPSASGASDVLWLRAALAGQAGSSCEVQLDTACRT